MARLPATLALLAVLAGCSAPTPVTPAPPTGLRDDLAAQAVLALGAAFTTHDADAAAALGADEDSSALLGAAVRNLGALDISVDGVRFIDDDPALTASLPRGTHAAVAELSWSFDGFDEQPSTAEVTVQLAQDDDRVRVTGFGGGERPLPLWLTGELTVRRTPGVQVVGSDAATVARVARLATVARSEVTATLGTPAPLVIEVPATGAEVDRVLGAEAGHYARIAAVTTFVGRDRGRRTPVHVVVNPDVLAGLGAAGAQIVLSHEATHAATDAVHARSPLWLLEGYADHVALRDTALPLARTAGQIAAQIRDRGLPQALPGAAEFDAQAGHLGAVYESAWRVVEVLVAAGGERLVLELYRRTAAGATAEEALQALYGFGEEELTRRWRADLRQIARAAR